MFDPMSILSITYLIPLKIFFHEKKIGNIHNYTIGKTPTPPKKHLVHIILQYTNILLHIHMSLHSELCTYLLIIMSPNS